MSAVMNRVRLSTCTIIFHSSLSQRSLPKLILICISLCIDSYNYYNVLANTWSSNIVVTLYFGKFHSPLLYTISLFFFCSPNLYNQLILLLQLGCQLYLEVNCLQNYEFQFKLISFDIRLGCVFTHHTLEPTCTQTCTSSPLHKLIKYTVI